MRDATLRVTPPNSATLGSGCPIDVQGWAGGQMIGGIRKLDVPPVQLPPNVDPPWLEPEISVAPTPLAPGQSALLLQRASLAATSGPTLFGDESRIDVAVKLDGQVMSGFTIQIQDSRVFLPLIRR